MVFELPSFKRQLMNDVTLRFTGEDFIDRIILSPVSFWSENFQENLFQGVSNRATLILLHELLYQYHLLQF